MKTTLIVRTLIILFALMAVAGCAPKRIELSKKKLEKLQALKLQLDQKRAKLESARNVFAQMINGWVNEINVIRQQNQLVDFAQAKANKLIANNLEAIRKAQAYNDITYAEILLTYEGQIEADRLQKQIQLDIVMLDSIEEKKLASIIKDLDLTIDKLQPRAEELVINQENTKLPELEAVWTQYFGQSP